MLDPILDSTVRAMPTYAQLAVGGLMGVVLLMLTYQAGKRFFGAIAPTFTAGLDAARHADDPATAVLGWIRRYIILICGGGMFLSSGVGLFTAVTVDANAPMAVGVLIVAGIDGFALSLIADLYYQARTGGNRVPPRVASWTIGAVSAWINFSHPLGGVEFMGLAPLLGLAALEWQVGRERSAARPTAARSLASALWGRLRAIVAARFAIDTGARDNDTERAMRIRKAGSRMYDLQRAQAGPASEKRLRRKERKAQQARADVGIPRDAEAHREVLAHMRMLATTRAEAADAAPAEPWCPAPELPPHGGAEHPTGSHAEGRAEGVATRGDGTSGVSSENVRNVPPETVRNTGRKSGGNGDRKQRHTRRSQPDVSDLIPAGQELYRELHEAEGSVTRARLMQRYKQRYGALGSDRASALWQALNNGHAPALD